MSDAKDYDLFLTQVNAIDNAQRGALLSGHVISVEAIGAIVDLGLKRDGIIPKSDIDRLPDEESVLNVGDEIAVMVVDTVDQDGNLVVMFNDRGRVRLKTRLNAGIQPGVVNLAHGWWPSHFQEGNLNTLTHDVINPAQEAAYEANMCMNDNLIEVTKV